MSPVSLCIQIYKLQLTPMADVAEGQQPPEPQKTEEQLQEEERAREEERKQQEEERKRLEEEARVKQEEDMKKLDEALKGSLKGLAKSADNTTLTYVKMVLAEKELERIFPSILRFSQIQHLDINTNEISDISIVQDFPHLISLDASKNKIKDLSAFQNEEKLPKLQFLNLGQNKIQVLTKVALPSLKKLTLSKNQIRKVEEWGGHPTIQILELSNTQLKKLKGLTNMKKLTELEVSQTGLTDVRGLENLPSLKKLTLKTNQLKGFMNPFPYLPALEHLDIEGNQITSLKELAKLDEHIKSINMLANPVTDELGENLKKQVIWAYPRLIKINDSPVTEEERVAFEKQRLEKEALEEKEREMREEEARKAAAQQEPEAEA